MRKGLVAGLSGLVCVAVLACGPQTDNPVIKIPDSITSAGTAIAMRITGPYGPNSDLVAQALGKMLNDNISFTDLVTRGGMPDGTLTGVPGGSALQQIKAMVDNGGYLDPTASVDHCGNTMLSAFVTPDMLKDIFPDQTAQLPGLAAWPGVCGDDLSCNTTKQGKWEIGFSKDHGDGSRDLVVTLSPTAGPTTTPGFQGNLIGYMLTADNTGSHLAVADLYGNVRSVTVSAFGLVKFAKAGISTRPSLPIPGQPTAVYAFPADTRALAGADLIVGVQAYSLCADSWAADFGSLTPFGCDQQKALLLDLSSQQGAALWSATKNGDDQAAVSALGSDLDDWIAAWEYQLKTQIACPTVTESKWMRQDIPLGSVEVFQCPEGDIDRCIARQDREDYWCEATPMLPDDGQPLEAELPMWTGGSSSYSGTFQAHTTNDPQTVTYKVGSQTYTLEWTLAYSEAEPLDVSQVVAELNKDELAGGGDVNLTFSVDPDGGGILAEAARDLGPGVGFSFEGDGTLNSKLGLNGAAAHSEPELPALAGDYYTIDAVNTSLDFAYVKVSGTAADPTVIYADDPSRILGVYRSSGSPLNISPRADTHCTTQGAVAWEIPQSAYVKVDVKTDGDDTISLAAGSIPIYIQ